MLFSAYVVVALLAVGIIIIGVMYISVPRMIAAGFGLRQPTWDGNVDGWLRLKGVRDIVSGLAVFAVMAWSGPRMVGIILLVEAMIPTGDMLTVLTSRGSTNRAFGIHGATAATMVALGAALAFHAI